jgi:hypothetical protein
MKLLIFFALVYQIHSSIAVNDEKLGTPGTPQPPPSPYEATSPPARKRLVPRDTASLPASQNLVPPGLRVRPRDGVSPPPGIPPTAAAFPIEGGALPDATVQGSAARRERLSTVKHRANTTQGPLAKSEAQ